MKASLLVGDVFCVSVFAVFAVGSAPFPSSRFDLFVVGGAPLSSSRFDDDVDGAFVCLERLNFSIGTL